MRGRTAPRHGRPTLDREVQDVVESGNCSGCGACVQLGPGLAMRLDDQGFLRPVREQSSGVDDLPSDERDRVAAFERICPGRTVRSPRPAGAAVHPTLGPALQAWELWAADEEVRSRGSSGGTLTALASWLTATGRAHEVVGASADAARPSRTVPVTITTREQALASAGSRYAPCATAAHPDLRTAHAVIGKPCEVAATAALIPEGSRPLLLSFFCAGTPSQHATDALVRELGADPDDLDDLWYRGRGWPGSFTAVPRQGDPVSTSYERSWGERLGRALQWRCKICVDGVGESADVVAADFWHADERGYPVFDEQGGRSAVVARTARGRELVLAAIEDGVLVGGPLSLDDLAGVQPLQVQRRRSLLGRLVGARLAGRRTPRYRRFGLLAHAVRRPLQAARTGRETHRRLSRGGTR